MIINKLQGLSKLNKPKNNVQLRFSNISKSYLSTSLSTFGSQSTFKTINNFNLYKTNNLSQFSLQNFHFPIQNFTPNNTLFNFRDCNIQQSKNYSTSAPNVDALLQKYLKQLLFIVHPDSLRRFADSPEVKTYIETNEKSLQSLNSFVDVLTNYNMNTQIFEKPSKPIEIRFFLYREIPKMISSELRVINHNNKLIEFKELKVNFAIPYDKRETWMRSGGKFKEVRMYQWRDSQLLNLLYHSSLILAYTMKGKKIEILPNEEEIDLLKHRAKETGIPLFPPCLF